MKYFFSSPERVAKLMYVSGLWIGTPWAANSQAKGEYGGVACHELPRCILIECGALPVDFPSIKETPKSSRHTRESIMEAWLETRKEFRRVVIGNEPIRPGDVLGIRICHCIDHLGLALTENLFTHVLMRKNTDCDYMNVPPWQQRIVAAWRPVEL